MNDKLNPLGIMPRCVWLGMRAVGLAQAIERYAFHDLLANVNLVQQWTEELNQILKELKETE